MLYKNHFIEINQHVINLAEHPHVFYRASKEERTNAIKSIIKSAKQSRIFVVTDKKIKGNDKLFYQDPKQINEYGLYIKYDIDRLYALFKTVKPSVQTIDELIELLGANEERERYTLVIIDEINKYKSNDFIYGLLTACQKGRAVGYHIILMDENYSKNLMIMANVPYHLNEKEKNKNDKNKLN